MRAFRNTRSDLHMEKTAMRLLQYLKKEMDDEITHQHIDR